MSKKRRNHSPEFKSKVALAAVKGDQTLSEPGQYYRMYLELMDYWRNTLPGFIYEQSYEDLVKSEKEQMSKLLQHCGLPWDDACVDFHKTRRKAKTASNAQVRRPIYETAGTFESGNIRSNHCLSLRRDDPFSAGIHWRRHHCKIPACAGMTRFAAVRRIGMTQFTAPSALPVGMLLSHQVVW